MNIEYIIIIIILLFIVDFIIKNNQRKISDNKNNKNIMSKTEYRIAEYLDRLGIKYKVQYTFMGCKDKKPLPFDFAILDEKGKVKMLIEYDGEQHFFPVIFDNQNKRDAERNFKLCQKHDKIKNNFCKRKKIFLLRISYLDNKNLYKIIKQTLYEKKILT